MSRRGAARRLRSLCVMLPARVPVAVSLTAAVMALSGCSLFSYSPSLELIKATGTAASFVVAGVPVKAIDTVRHGAMRIDSVCIAFNPGVALQGFLPALQTSLQRQRVDSRVFESDTPTPLCSVWLHYAASVEWGTPPWGNSMRPYVARATLTLKNPQGLVLSSSNFEPGGVIEMGKWAATSDKVDAVVTALLGASDS